MRFRDKRRKKIVAITYKAISDLFIDIRPYVLNMTRAKINGIKQVTYANIVDDRGY